MINLERLNFTWFAARRTPRILRQTPARLLLLPLLVASFGGASAFAQEVDTVYQLRSDGFLVQNLCTGDSCDGGVILDRNSSVKSITSGGAGLFETLTTGAIRQFTGTPCNFFDCEGWLQMDNNAGTKAIAAGSGFGSGSNPYLFQLHASGWIWQSTGVPCSGNSCPGWIPLDTNAATKHIIAAGGNMNLCFDTSCPPTPAVPPLVQVHANGSVWQYNGTPCKNGVCQGWTQIDNAHAGTQEFGFANGFGGAGSIFQLHDGTIFRYTGQPCNYGVCPGWQPIGNAPFAKQAVAAENTARLYVLNNDGNVWELTASGWVEVDNTSQGVSISASNNGLFELRSDGSVWYRGANGWVLVDNNGATAIAASSFFLPQQLQ